MKFYIPLILLFSMIYVGCKTEGCTYAEASNYDADADVDDGTCVYDEDSNDDTPSSDFWVGVYNVSQTSIPTSSSDTPESYTSNYSISIIAFDSESVIIQNLIGCPVQAIVTSNTMQALNVSCVELGNLAMTRTDEGFSFNANTYIDDVTSFVVGEAIKQ